MNEMMGDIGNGILDGISKGFDIIGPNVKQVFYSEMMLTHKLSKNEILERPEEFTEAMSTFFKVGTTLVERAIGQEIVKNFGIPVCAGLNFKIAVEIVLRHPGTKKRRMSEGTLGYNPSFCKTCQVLGKPDPTVARVPFSDCQEHYMKRVLMLKKTIRTEGRFHVNPMFNL
jgi:hypothetical protein